MEALKEIVKDRKEEERKKLFHDNAVRFYGQSWRLRLSSFSRSMSLPLRRARCSQPWHCKRCCWPIPHRRDPEPPDKGPGFLGVTFESAEQDQAVQDNGSAPRGPADRGGLRVGDVIRKFNGEPVNFELFATRIIRIPTRLRGAG